MAAANWFRYVYLAHLARPKSVRQLFRFVRRHEIRRIVEVGIRDLAEAVSLIEVAQRYAGQRGVCYTAIDWFEARAPELEPLSLKDAYRRLRPTGASIRLVPGEPGPALAATANAHQNTDLLLIAPMVADAELEHAWFFVPRMLHDRSLVLRAERDVAGEAAFARLTSGEISAAAARVPRRCAA